MVLIIVRFNVLWNRTMVLWGTGWSEFVWTVCFVGLWICMSITAACSPSLMCHSSLSQGNARLLQILFSFICESWIYDGTQNRALIRRLCPLHACRWFTMNNSALFRSKIMNMESVRGAIWAILTQRASHLPSASLSVFYRGTSLCMYPAQVTRTSRRLTGGLWEDVRARDSFIIVEE